MGLGGRGWAQPEEVCNAKIAFNGARKIHAFLLIWTPPSVLLFGQYSRATFCFGTALKMHILILITSILNLRRFVMLKWLLIKAPETYPHPIYLDPS